ncbi:MAG: TIGR02449 family protein [Gammaproteobacteria bacterium]|nr:TIGR02449 family protein [Gammaproteobacteria bacterium]
MDKLQALEGTIDVLIDHCQQLAADNGKLRAKEAQWQWEREQLIKKNEVARSRVEAMINRLKGLKPENP